MKFDINLVISNLFPGPQEVWHNRTPLYTVLRFHANRRKYDFHLFLFGNVTLWCCEQVFGLSFPQGFLCCRMALTRWFARLTCDWLWLSRKQRLRLAPKQPSASCHNQLSSTSARNTIHYVSGHQLFYHVTGRPAVVVTSSVHPEIKKLCTLQGMPLTPLFFFM